MIQDVYIIGATGKVGNVLVEQIIKNDTDPKIHTNPTRIVGLASSTHTIYSPKGLSHEQALNFANRHYDDAQEYDHLSQLLEVGRQSLRDEKSILIFVDVTALNEPMTEFHLMVMGETSYDIVTANKNPIALSDYPTFQRLTGNIRRYGYRCSVMAGAESVTFLQDLKDVNDRAQKIEGCFSGTLGYITSELEKGRKFSEVIREANEKGYTEPHPRDDLNGLDVARKLVVLARTAGYAVGMENVEVKPFIPEEYFSEDDVHRFLDAMSRLDGNFEERMTRAKNKGLTLRYIGKMDATSGNVKLEVSLQEVLKQSPLGSLGGTVNKLFVVSSTYPHGYSVEAPGAGLEVTAQNIRRDLLHLLPERKIIS